MRSFSKLFNRLAKRDAKTSTIINAQPVQYATIDEALDAVVSAAIKSGQADKKVIDAQKTEKEEAEQRQGELRIASAEALRAAITKLGNRLVDGRIEVSFGHPSHTNAKIIQHADTLFSSGDFDIYQRETNDNEPIRYRIAQWIVGEKFYLKTIDGKDDHTIQEVLQTMIRKGRNLRFSDEPQLTGMVIPQPLLTASPTG